MNCLSPMILVSLVVVTVSANMDVQEHFCGAKLMKTLTELCAYYNSPAFAAHHNRFRRQIIQECCTSPCTRRYLTQYYCSQANSSFNNSNNSTSNNTKTSNKNNSAKQSNNDGDNEKNTNSLKSFTSHNHSHKLVKIARGKRNCKCRKRRAQRVKKLRQLQAKINRARFGKPAPPPNIGHIEESEKPFYVARFGFFQQK